MAISGYFSEFSLSEIFLLLEQGSKTGRLSIQEQSEQSSRKGKIFYIWFKQGNIAAATDRTDGQGLLLLIQRRGWISAPAAERVLEVCSIDQPAGLCLKTQGLLEAEQLKLIFSQQVLQEVCKLFQLKDGKFQFDANLSLPSSEMTGLTAPAREVTLAGLRVLRDWTMLQDKMPESISGLASVVKDKPKLRLNQLEWQVWEFANGKVPIQDIAKQLQLPLEKIQQVAFRLMVVGLAEEIPFVASAPPQKLDLEMEIFKEEERTAPVKTTFSQSFLNNLVGFLKSKT